MKNPDPIAVALQFNDRISDRDVDGLGLMMTEDHTFIDKPGEVTRGRKIMIKGWAEFFEAYPDYRNVFTRIEARGSQVIMLGHSECSYEPLDGPAIWTAIIRDGLVAEWRVYEDDAEVRRELDLDWSSS